MVVWKYPLRLVDKDVVRMPRHAEVVLVDSQGDSLCLWAIVNPDNVREERTFRIVGTGHHMDSGPGVTHVGSCQQGWSVWHVFEVDCVG